MSKIALYAPLPGVKDALNLLTLLSDKKERQKVLDITAGLETERKRLNGTIETVAKAVKIPGLLADAEDRHARATKILDEAGDAARGIRSEADAYADGLRKKLLKRERDCEAREAAAGKAESTFDARQKGTTKALSEREATLVKREKTATQKLEVATKQANAVTAEYEAKMAALHKAMA